MNRNEFYKQLMSEYSFDAEKIRENAKRKKPARQKLQPMYIGMAAAAAVCVVTVGTIAAVSLGRNGGVSLVDTGLTHLSASDRLTNALAQLEKEKGSEEAKDFLVTFSAPMSPEQARSVLTGWTDGSVPVKQLYFSDGTKLSGADSIEKVFSGGGTYEITGAAVYCSGDTASKLQSDPSVFLVEQMDEVDFDNAAPVNISDLQTSEVTPPDDIIVPPVTTPPQPVVPVDPVIDGTSDSTPTSDEQSSDSSSSEEMDGTAEPTSETTDESDGEPLPDETNDQQDTLPDDPIAPPVTNESEPDGGDNNSSVPPIEDTTSSQPADNTEPTLTLPDGVSLPSVIESLSYNTYIVADTAYFISDDLFYVRTDSGISLYRYDGSSETLICSEDIQDVKTVWVSENGGSLIVSGLAENGTRGRMLLVDSNAEEIIDLSSEDYVMSGTLIHAGYNAESGLLAMNIREDGTYYVNAARLVNGSLEYIGMPFTSNSKVTLAASSGDTIYLTESTGDAVVLYAVNAKTGSCTEVHRFDAGTKVSRNLAFNYAVFTPSYISVTGMTEILDPKTGSLITVYDSEGNLSFGASRCSFTSSGSLYTISGGTVSPSSDLSMLAPVEYRKSFSEKWCAAASGGTVKITESVYNRRYLSAEFVYEPAGNASGELKKAANGAVGVNNALALGRLSESGINTAQKLDDCISLYYSESAARKLKHRCSFDGVSLSCTDGGLTAVNAAESVLIINSQNDSSASGVICVKAGTFAGKTAYRQINVTFVRENGIWKLDNVLG